MNFNKRAAFLDRDGVINIEKNYVHKAKDFQIIPGVITALQLLKAKNFLIIVITNQSGIARGLYSLEDVLLLHDYMTSIFAENGIGLDDIYFCPHHIEGMVREFSVDCNCRKPRPGMIIQARNKHEIDLSSSLLVGDKLTDIAAGFSAGIGCNILVKSGHPIIDFNNLQVNYIADDLLSAIQLYFNK